MIALRLLENLMYTVAGAMIGFAVGSGLIWIGDHAARGVGW